MKWDSEGSRTRRHLSGVWCLGSRDGSPLIPDGPKHSRVHPAQEERPIRRLSQTLVRESIAKLNGRTFVTKTEHCGNEQSTAFNRDRAAIRSSSIFILQAFII